MTQRIPSVFILVLIAVMVVAVAAIGPAAADDPAPPETTGEPAPATVQPEPTPIMEEEPPVAPMPEGGVGPQLHQTFCQLDIDDRGDNNPFTYTFSAVNAHNIASFAWNLGDGTTPTGQTVNHTYSGTGTFPITLTCTPSDGGADLVLSGSISVTSMPVAYFELSPSTNITGLPPFTITTVNQSSGGALTYAWEIRTDGGTVLHTATTENVSYTFNDYGTFWFKLTVTDGAGTASTAFERSVVFNAPQPRASFTVDPQSGNAPLTVTIETVDFEEGPIDTWEWNLGDGTTFIDSGPGPFTFTHEYTTENTYTITLTYSGPGGNGTVARQVGVLPPSDPVTAQFTWEVVDDPATTEIEVCFTNTSLGPVVTSMWDWEGDGTFDETNNASVVCHAYATPGWRTVRLFVENIDGTKQSTGSDSVNVVGAPVADFTVTPGFNITWGTSISLDGSLSSGAIDTYSWDIDGDGAEDYTGETVSGINLTTLGDNPIRLTVTGPGGTAYAEKVVFVARLEITCDFTAASGTFNLLPGDGPQTYNSVIGNDGGRAITYEWTITGSGAGLPQTGSAASIGMDWRAGSGGPGPGDYLVTLEASTADGSSCSESKTVHVSWSPIECTMSNDLPGTLFADGNAYTFAAAVGNLDTRDPNDITYAWYLNGSEQLGETSDSFGNAWNTEPAAVEGQTVRYVATLDNGDGTFASCEETVTFNLNPWVDPTCSLNLSALPSPLYANGSTYTIGQTTGNIESRPITYTWYVDGSVVAGPDGTTSINWTNTTDSVLHPDAVIRYEVEVDNGNGTTSSCFDERTITVAAWPSLDAGGGACSGSINGPGNPLVDLPSTTGIHGYSASINGLAGRTTTYAWTVSGASPTAYTGQSVSVYWPTASGSVGGTPQTLSINVEVTNPDSTTESCTITRTVSARIPDLTCPDPTGDAFPVVNETETYNHALINNELRGRVPAFLWELQESDGVGGWTPVAALPNDLSSFSYLFATAGQSYRLRYTATVSEPDAADSCTSGWYGIGVAAGSVNFDCDAFPLAGNNFAPDSNSASYAYTVDMDNGNLIDLHYSWVLVGPNTTERVLATSTDTGNGLVTGPAISGALMGPIGGYTLRVDVRAVNNSDPMAVGYSEHTCSMQQTLDVGTINVSYGYAYDGGGSVDINAVPVGDRICFTNNSETSHPPGDVSQLDYTWSISGDAAHNSLGVNSYDGEALPACFSFDEPGTYTVDLYGENDHQGDATYRRSDSHSVTFTVYGLQSLSMDRSAGVFAGATYTFEAFGVNLYTNPNYQWTFEHLGSGATMTATGQNPSEYFADTGTYRATVTGQGPLGQVEASMEFTLIAANALRASFVPSIYGGIAPLRVCFTDTSQGVNIQDWTWDFGNGETLDYTAGNEPTEICTTFNDAASVYSVTLEISNGSLTENALNTIRTYTLMESSVTFSITPQSSSQFCYTAQLEGDVEVIGWDLGDGSADPGAVDNVCHNYSASGSYIVKLFVKDPDTGEEGEIIREVIVDLTGGGNPSLAATGTCSADRTASFEVVNSGDAMTQPDQVLIKDMNGQVVFVGSMLLGAGETRTFSVNNISGPVHFSTVDLGITADTTCAYPAGVSLDATCDGGVPVFSFTNLGGPMTDAQTYDISDGGGALISSGSFQLDAGESLQVWPAGGVPFQTYTLTTTGTSISAAISHTCDRDPNNPAITVPPEDPEGDSGEPGGPGVPVTEEQLTTYGLSIDLMALPAWEGVPGCGHSCPPFRLYHTDETGDWEIFRLDGADPASETSFRQNLTFGEGATDMAPTLSPNHQWIVFSSNRDTEDGQPENWELYVASTSGDPSSVRRITFNTIAIDTDPVWGPHNYVVFETTRHGHWDLYLMDMDTGEFFRVTDDEADDINAAWSPDGSRIAFQSNRDGDTWQLYEFDLRTMTVRKLSDGSADDVEPQYSGDGAHIVYRTHTGPETPSQLALMNSDGSNPRTITGADEDATNPAFSPSGRYLAYQSDLDGDLDIYVYEVATGAVRKLTGNDIADYAPTWMCGDDRLLFTSEIMGHPDIFEADTLPLDAAPIDLTVAADRMTFGDWLDIYPQMSPAEENASREGATVLGTYGRQTAFLEPDAYLTEEDPSLDGDQRADWPSFDACPVLP